MNYFNELNEIPHKELDIWVALLKAGYDTYLVGGAVRDIVLGNSLPNDFDFATKADPDEIAKVFLESDYRIDYVGASFGVMLIDGVEIATFRGDRYFGGGDKDVQISYVDTIEEDLARRDFTFNAMALDWKGNLIDPYNGVRDLKYRRPVVRFVGDANVRIAEDPNRIFRGFRFATVLEGVLSADSFRAVEDNLDKVALIAPERIRLEILKTLSTHKNASYFWVQLQSTGVLDIIFPEFAKSYKHDHGEYHPEDVWEHSMIAGNHVSTKFPLVKLAAYLHDVGKPRSYDPKARSFYQHHVFSADILREWLTDMKFSNDEIRFVVNLALIHMDGTRFMTPKARRKLKKKIGDYGLDWHDYVRVRIADRAANLGRNNFTLSQIRDYVEIFNIDEEVPLSTHDLALSGGEIIRIFNIKPGPLVSTIQNFLLDRVVEEGDDVNTVETLTSLAEAEFNLS